MSTFKARSATAAVGIALTAFTAATATVAAMATMASAAPTTHPAPSATVATPMPSASSSAASAPAPKATSTAPPTIASVTARLTALSNRNEVLTEDYNLAVVEVKAKQAQVEAARVAARESAGTYRSALDNVRLSLQAQYQEGNFPTTSALLTSTSGQNYLDKSTALQQISTRRAGMATQLDRARLASAKASARLVQLLAAAKSKRDALAAQRVTLAAQQKTYSQLLDQLNAKQQRAFLQPVSQGLTKKELATVGVLSAPSSGGSSSESTAGDQPSGSASATAGGTKPSSGTSSRGESTSNKSSGHKPRSRSQSNSGSSSSAGSAGSSAPSSAAAIAVRYALAQLGKPYVYATSGPRTFDCSGLTAAAWRAAGKSIPHQSRLQSHLGHRVSKSQLKPGDLVFYYSPIHHVAIYIGKGLVVSAPQTGDVVKIVPVDHAGTYNMAVRL